MRSVLGIHYACLLRKNFKYQKNIFKTYLIQMYVIKKDTIYQSFVVLDLQTPVKNK